MNDVSRRCRMIATGQDRGICRGGFRDHRPGAGPAGAGHACGAVPVGPWPVHPEGDRDALISVRTVDHSGPAKAVAGRLRVRPSDAPATAGSSGRARPPSGRTGVAGWTNPASGRTWRLRAWCSGRDAQMHRRISDRANGRSGERVLRQHQRVDLSVRSAADRDGGRLRSPPHRGVGRAAHRA